MPPRCSIGTAGIAFQYFTMATVETCDAICFRLPNIFPLHFSWSLYYIVVSFSCKRISPIANPRVCESITARGSSLFSDSIHSLFDKRDVKTTSSVILLGWYCRFDPLSCKLLMSAWTKLSGFGLGGRKWIRVFIRWKIRLYSILKHPSLLIIQVMLLSCSTVLLQKYPSDIFLENQLPRRNRILIQRSWRTRSRIVGGNHVWRT